MSYQKTKDMEKTNEALLCYKCSLQVGEKTIQIKEENEGLVIHCDNTKSKASIPSKGTKSHTCSICNYTTSYKGNLKQHIESVHEGKKPHKCSICEYRCSEKRKHIK